MFPVHCFASYLGYGDKCVMPSAGPSVIQIPTCFCYTSVSHYYHHRDCCTHPTVNIHSLWLLRVAERLEINPLSAFRHHMLVNVTYLEVKELS